MCKCDHHETLLKVNTIVFKLRLLKELIPDNVKEECKRQTGKHCFNTLATFFNYIICVNDSGKKCIWMILYQPQKEDNDLIMNEWTLILDDKID